MAQGVVEAVAEEHSANSERSRWPYRQDSTVGGVILADQLKSLDWEVRKAQLAGRAGAETIEDVIALILPLDW
jgi:mRNA-degrading endonuclease toxin of MazEF toxin-antitoxin module